MLQTGLKCLSAASSMTAYLSNFEMTKFIDSKAATQNHIHMQ